MVDETSAEQKASESTDTSDDTDDVDDVDDVPADDDAAEAPVSEKTRMSHVQLATIAGLVLVVGLGALAGWTGYNAYQAHQAEQQREVFLQVGRQGAINLTTIDWEQADADVRRVLDSSTGAFYDDFEARAQPFLEVVKQTRAKSVGTITEAGLESVSGDEAQVLVAIKVDTSNAGAPEQDPRAWRMRLTVQEVDGNAKVSNVEFVP